MLMLCCGVSARSVAWGDRIFFEELGDEALDKVDGGSAKELLLLPLDVVLRVGGHTGLQFIHTEQPRVCWCDCC